MTEYIFAFTVRKYYERTERRERQSEPLVHGTPDMKLNSITTFLYMCLHLDRTSSFSVGIVTVGGRSPSLSSSGSSVNLNNHHEGHRNLHKVVTVVTVLFPV